MNSVEERVARGVALLDEKVPGWVDRVHPEILMLSSTTGCVLGQLFNNYWLGCRRLGLGDFPFLDGASYGFSVSGYPFMDEYAALTTEWKRVIGILRQAPRVEPKELVGTPVTV